VDIDMDVQRDAASAFGPASLTTGALLPYEGRTLLKRPEGLPAGGLDARADGWVTPDVPVLVRGQVRILPLAWSGTEVPTEAIDAFASQMQAAGMHWAGNWRMLSLTEDRTDSIGSYVAALRASGATRVDCWTYTETVGIALVWGDDDGSTSLAWHIVPVSWVSEPRVGKPVKQRIDIRWSWDEVVALRTAAFDAEAPGDR